VLGLDPSRIPSVKSWSYNEILRGVRHGRIKGLWIVGTNPAHSWIDRKKLGEALGELEFLVVQDMYRSTETAQLAHLVLPAAGWGEKEGTFINSERRIGLIKKVRRAPGQALSDFAIFKLVAHYWGCEELFERWDSPEATFALLRELTRGQPCDITGIPDYRFLDESGGVQWPYPEHGADPAPERRLFTDGRYFHPDGRARLVHASPRPLPEPPDESYPLLLLTGRGSAAQWHTQTRTAKSAVLRALAPEGAYVEMHPDDAADLGVVADEEVVVESRRGRLRARAFLTYTVQRGQVFVPMHDAGTNALTFGVHDPHSKQPAYKASAVRVVKST
jgi:assimilatory nitrate reductase catalytic subunit